MGARLSHTHAPDARYFRPLKRLSSARPLASSRDPAALHERRPTITADHPYRSWRSAWGAVDAARASLVRYSAHLCVGEEWEGGVRR